MGQITDPAILAEIQRQQQAAAGGATLAGPSAAQYGAPMVNPGRQAAQNQADARLTLAEQAAARTAANEAERLRLAAEENARQQAKAERDRTKANATGGVDTTEAENTAAFLTTQLSGHVKRINEINKDFPEAMKPGWAEWVGGLFGPRGKALATPDAVEDARIQLNNRYALAADVLLTLGTGAAYTAEQKKAYVESYAPQVTDTPAVLADKKRMMREALVAAKVKSGAAVGAIDRAALMLDQLYGDEEGPEKQTAISTESQSVEVPQGYQDEHRAFVVQNMGKLTVDDYLNFRKQLDKKYTDNPDDPNTYTTNYSRKDAEEFVKTVNAGLGANQEIAPTDTPLDEGDKLRAKIAADPTVMGGVSAVNAATMGLVDAMANGQGKGDRLEMMRENSPKANLLGEVVGSIAPMKGLQVGATKVVDKLASQLTPAARKRFMADTAANSVYGGARGAASTGEDESVLAETAKGVGMGAASSAAASVVTRGVTPLTSKGYQEAIELVPSKTILQFNSDNANRALKYIGERLPKGIKPGTEMTDAVHNRLSNAYEQIKPSIGGSADATFDNAVTALKGLAKGRDRKAMFAEIDDALKLFKDPTTGHYTGQGYKNASERLRYLAKQWSTKAATQGDVAADDMARMAEQARKQMQTLIMRQTPDVGQKLKQVERGWAHLIRIEEAGNRALKNDGIYTPGNYIDGVKKFDNSARKNASSRGRAFDQKYAMAAEKALGSKGVPTVGMGDRLRFATVMGATAGAAHDPKTAAIVAALSYGLYGPRAKQITKQIFLGKRPSKVDNEYLHNIMADALRHQTTGE